MVTLNTAPGDGSLNVGVDAFGSFGSVADGPETSNAFLNPLGEIESTETVFESFIAVDILNDDIAERTILSEETLTAPEFTSVTENTATSSFAYSGLNFALEQEVFDAALGEERIGSNLRQTYTISNPTAGAIDFELVRYLDGDIEDGDTDLDAAILDNGRRATQDGDQILFQTDSSINDIYVPVFVGISTSDSKPNESYEINESEILRPKIVAGEPLGNIVAGDGDDAGQFTDEPYESSLAVAEAFSLQPGESLSYTITTIFLSGVSEDASEFFPIEQSDNGGIIEDATGVDVYRFFRTDTQTQFYTTTDIERDTVLETLPQYEPEGISFVGALAPTAADPLTGTSPVYRFFNTTTGVHLYTADENERAFVQENLANYVPEGTPYSGYDTQVEGTVPLYRFYNAGLDAHFYTPNAEERDFYIESPDYQPEGGGDGIAFYVEPAPEL